MPEDRHRAIELIDEACAAGARQAPACGVLELDVRTVRRWRKQQREEQRMIDRRREVAAGREPANKLSQEERDGYLWEVAWSESCKFYDDGSLLIE